MISAMALILVDSSYLETLLDSKPKLMCRHAGVADLSFSNSKDENMVVDRI